MSSRRQLNRASSSRAAASSPNLFADASEMSAYRARSAAAPRAVAPGAKAPGPDVDDDDGDEQPPAAKSSPADHRLLGDDTLSRCCVANNCARERYTDQVFCHRHWHELPVDLRAQIESTYKRRSTFVHRGLLRDAVALLGKRESDPPVPKNICRVPNCCLECVGGFCSIHEAELPVELAEQLRAAMGPGGNVRRAWALLDEAKAYLTGRESASV